jgi:uncharacterized SAM-binding protein YcdF (DUF218 family)
VSGRVSQNDGSLMIGHKLAKSTSVELVHDFAKTAFIFFVHLLHCCLEVSHEGLQQLILNQTVVRSDAQLPAVEESQHSYFLGGKLQVG